MGHMTIAELATWGIAAASAGGVVIRPWGLPEAVWAILGAGLLLLLGLLPWREALPAIAKGTDVYLFLTGMMLLAELARLHGLFDWLATHVAMAAKGSAQRLFALVYCAGIVVTVFLSNDATAVVLTPAVYAAAKAAKANPLSYLYICAYIANAASFVLPISNPANLVLYGNSLPPLLQWLEQFLLPSILAIAATYVALRWIFRNELSAPVAPDAAAFPLSHGGRYTAFGLALTAIALLMSSAFGIALGAPTFAAGSATSFAVLRREKEPPGPLLQGIAWGILPLVAGLFVLVEGLNNTGAAAHLAQALNWGARHSVTATVWATGTGVAAVSNLINNLPAGLLARSALDPLQFPPAVSGAFLIGVDLGPNLSVTGSLATILWLVALRREGLRVSAREFLRAGVIAMPPALALAIGGLLLTS
ncbi:MAG: arsenic transporter [Rhodomicrobium sp.]